MNEIIALEQQWHPVNFCTGIRKTVTHIQGRLVPPPAVLTKCIKSHLTYRIIYRDNLRLGVIQEIAHSSRRRSKISVKNTRKSKACLINCQWRNENSLCCVQFVSKYWVFLLFGQNSNDC